MRRKTLLMLCALLLPTASAAAHPIHDESLQLFFESPEGFQSMTPADKALRYIGREPPHFAVGIAGSSATISYDSIKDGNAAQLPLPALQKVLSELLEKREPTRWGKNEIVTINGREWIYMETSATAANGNVRNMMLIAAHQGAIVTVNFSASELDFPSFSEAFTKSMESLRLGPAVAPKP